MEQQIVKTDWQKVSEIELVYRPIVRPSERPVAIDAAAAYSIFINTWDSDKLQLVEQFKVMLLNRNSRVLGICTISTGGISQTVVDMKLIFAAALKAAASGIIICHNHPSGSLKPSRADLEVTSKIKTAGLYMDINVVDHLIITDHSYCSLALEGFL